MLGNWKVEVFAHLPDKDGWCDSSYHEIVETVDLPTALGWAKCGALASREDQMCLYRVVNMKTRQIVMVV